MSLNKKFLITSIFLLIATNILVGYNFTNQYVFLLWIVSIILLLKSYEILTKNFCSNLLDFLKNFYSFKFFAVLWVFCIFRIFGIYNANILKTHHDEITFTISSYELLQNFLKTHSLNMLGAQYGPISSFPSLWYCFQAFFLYFFGLNIYAPKIYPFLTDLGIISILWYYGKKYLKSDNTAFFTSLFYASFAPSVFFSLTTYNNLQSSFFYCLVFLLLMYADDKYIKEKKEKYYIFVGLATGFSYYSYLSSIVLPLFPLCFLFYLFIRDKNLKVTIKKSSFFALGYIYTCLPFWIYSFFRYNFIFGRQSAILGNSQNLYQILYGLYDRTILLFKIFYNANWNNDFYVEMNFFDNKLFFYFFILGIIISLYNIKKREYFLIICFFFLTFLTGGILTTGSTPVQRMLPIIWSATILVGIALTFMLKIILYPFNKIHFLNKKFLLYTSLTASFFYILFLQCDSLKKVFSLSRQGREEIIDLIDYQKGNYLPVTGLLPGHINQVFYIYTQNYDYPIFHMENKKRYNELLNKKIPHYFLIYKDFLKNDLKFSKYRHHYRRVNTNGILSDSFTHQYALYKFKE